MLSAVLAIMNGCVISDNDLPFNNGDEQNHANESEDDASVEGGVVRNLFQMYSSSSSCSLATTATAADEEEEDPLTCIDLTVQEQSHILHKMIVDDVILAQQGMKTISNILWYAFLDFLLEGFFVSSPSLVLIMNFEFFFDMVSLGKAFRYLLGIVRFEFL